MNWGVGIIFEIAIEVQVLTFCKHFVLIMIIDKTNSRRHDNSNLLTSKGDQEMPKQN